MPGWMNHKVESRLPGDKMIRQHHRLNGHEFEQTLGDSEGQGSLACYSPQGHKELDMTELRTAQMVKNLPAMLQTWVQSLGWEDLLEKGMATHSSILAWRTSWTEEPGKLQSMGSQKSDMTEGLTHTLNFQITNYSS